MTTDHVPPVADVLALIRSELEDLMACDMPRAGDEEENLDHRIEPQNTSFLMDEDVLTLDHPCDDTEILLEHSLPAA